jgi:hypothetical protein
MNGQEWRDRPAVCGPFGRNSLARSPLQDGRAEQHHAARPGSGPCQWNPYPGHDRRAVGRGTCGTLRICAGGGAPTLHVEKIPRSLDDTQQDIPFAAARARMDPLFPRLGFPTRADCSRRLALLPRPPELCVLSRTQRWLIKPMRGEARAAASDRAVAAGTEGGMRRPAADVKPCDARRHPAGQPAGPAAPASAQARPRAQAPSPASDVE